MSQSSQPPMVPGGASAAMSASSMVPTTAGMALGRGSRPGDRHYPPPRLTAHQVVWRYLVAGLGLMIDIVSVCLVARRDSPNAMGVAGVAITTTVGLVCLWLMRYRRRWPLAIAYLSVCLPALSGASFATTDWALMSLATRRRLREVVPVGLVCVVSREASLMNPLNAWVSGSARTALALHLTTLGASALEVALMVAIGFYIGARRDLVANLREQVQITQREQELVVLHAEAQERNRIAREMHDVVAHRISLVAMHAGALAYRNDLSPEQTHEIAQTIQENAAASLTELRSVLGQLRSASDQPVPVLPDKPQPTLRDVAGLVRDARGAGMAVEFTDAVERPDLLPAQTGRHAYRIVQEALTNARKHAGGARVLVQMGGGPGRGLDVLVQNPLRPGASMLPGSGAGLGGMHERAQMVGGQLSAGAQNGYFEVKVWFPW